MDLDTLGSARWIIEQRRSRSSPHRPMILFRRVLRDVGVTAMLCDANGVNEEYQNQLIQPIQNIVRSLDQRDLCPKQVFNPVQVSTNTEK